MKVSVLKPFGHYVKGNKIELVDEVAKNLISKDFVEKAKEEKTPKAEKE